MKRIVTICVILVLLISTFSAFAITNQELLAQIVSFKIFMNGSEKSFSKPIITINDSTYIPLRELAETLEMDVQWDERNQSIIINKTTEKEEAVLYPFESEGLWGYTDNQGKIIVAPEYYEANEFKEGLALVGKSGGQNGQYGFIDINGDVVIPCIYYMAYSFNNGAALVSLATHTDKDRWTYIDKQGNRLFDKEFILARDFSENYAVVLKEGYGFPVSPEVDIPRKWTYIDKSGNFATEKNFEDAKDFSNGYAGVKNDGKWGVIDKCFNLIVPYSYDDVGKVENGVISVKEGDDWIKINI